jgi:aminopeptidase-like protein
VRKRLKEVREQRDYVEQTKGTRDQFERDLTGLFHNYQCQVSQMVAKEPLKMFLVDLEQNLDRVVGKIWKLLWGGGLTRDRMDELVQDKAFSIYFEWQAEHMLHHAKMVKRKVVERAQIFAQVCEKARVDPLTQGIKAVLRYHLCGRAVKDQEDKQRSAQRKMDHEVDLVQQELLENEEREKVCGCMPPSTSSPPPPPPTDTPSMYGFLDPIVAPCNMRRRRCPLLHGHF